MYAPPATQLEGRALFDRLLAPTRIYVKPLLALMKAMPVHGLAHITGGGLTDNIPRVLPEGLEAVLERRAWPRDPVRVLESMLEAGTRDAVELAEAARRVVVPELLRRRAVATLEPAIFDPEFERTLVSAWSRGGTDAATPEIYTNGGTRCPYTTLFRS